MSLVIFDRRHLVLRARSLTAAVGGRFLPTVHNSTIVRVAGKPALICTPRRRTGNS